MEIFRAFNREFHKASPPEDNPDENLIQANHFLYFTLASSFFLQEIIKPINVRKGVGHNIHRSS
ncbi:MAG: hypothetical protein WBQ25_21435 [Nitrososphaeraceae archaeon]